MFCILWTFHDMDLVKIINIMGYNCVKGSYLVYAPHESA